MNGAGQGSGNRGQGGGNRGQGGGTQNGGGKGKMAWRKIAPKENEPQQKELEGIKYNYCATCRGGKGLWTRGEGIHKTSEHDPTKWKQK